MKSYNVTIIENNKYSWQNIINVTVADNEHPRKKAIETICEIGWRRDSEAQKIIKITRIK